MSILAPGTIRRTGCRPLVLILAILPMACTSPTPDPDMRLVRQIDHIKLVSGEARGLFAVLTDTLRLPVAWPMTDYGGFVSGGVAIGDVNLEIIQTEEGAPRFTGFALEPAPLDEVLTELKARGIRHGPPAPYRARQPDGTMQTRWTTVSLPEVSRDAVEVFFCAYTHDVPARRRSLRDALQALHGGPLGVVATEEIVYGARDAEAMHAAWERLLAPASDSLGRWSLSAGPAIRVIRADEDEIRSVVLGVRSLAEARRFLEDHDLLGEVRGDTLMLKGMSMALVEAAPLGASR
ncbi:MAG: VOC family protein [Rhodothermales bacterium]